MYIYIYIYAIYIYIYICYVIYACIYIYIYIYISLLRCLWGLPRTAENKTGGRPAQLREAEGTGAAAFEAGRWRGPGATCARTEATCACTDGGDLNTWDGTHIGDYTCQPGLEVCGPLRTLSLDIAGCVYPLVCMHIHMYVRIYIYIYTHIHTYIQHTHMLYIHIYIYIS